MNFEDSLRLLVETLRDCADQNMAVGSEYARGKACAFQFAAKWLEQEVNAHEKESR